MTGKEFAAYLMPRYNFRKDAADLILANWKFELLDPYSQAGGGDIDFSTREIIFHTSQHEAGIHELAHAWLQEATEGGVVDGGEFVDNLVEAFLKNADLPDEGYPTVRQLCRVYKYGDGDVFPGMWVGEPYNRWNEHEIWAGLASGTMCQLWLMPDDLYSLYEHMLVVSCHCHVSYLPYVSR